METISEELVEKTWKESSALSREDANRSMLKTCEGQPDLVAYVTTLTKSRDEEVKELAVTLFFVLYQIFRKGAPGELKRIPAEEIARYHENNLSLMQRLEKPHDKFVHRAARIQLAGQPHVMKFLVETLVEPGSLEDPLELSEEDKGLLYVVLKTVVDLFDEKG
jgi:hypothetical protein